MTWESLGKALDKVQQGSLTLFVALSQFARIADLADGILRHRIRQVTVHTTRTEISCVHARTGHRFGHIEHVFALAERVDEHRRATAVVPVRAEPHQMVGNARQFGKHHPNVLGAQWHLNPKELFDREAEPMLIAQHGAVIKPIHVGQGLHEGLVLSQFFGCAVQQTDVRIGTLDHLTIEFQHQAKHAMRSWMLGSKVERVVLDFSHVVRSTARSRRQRRPP